MFHCRGVHVCSEGYLTSLRWYLEGILPSFRCHVNIPLLIDEIRRFCRVVINGIYACGNLAFIAIDIDFDVSINVNICIVL